MAINFRMKKDKSSRLYGKFLRESMEMFGLEVIYYPLWDYDMDESVFYGEDNMPRYSKGVPLTLYYEEPESVANFLKFGMDVEAELTLYVSKDEFIEKFPVGLKDVDYIGPKENDWFELTEGEIRTFAVTYVDEGEWTLGDFHSYQIDAVPRKYSHEYINDDPGTESMDFPEGTTTISPSSTTTESSGTSATEFDDATGTDGTEFEDVISDADEIQEEADDFVIDDNDTDYWGDY